jgi:hypothetical protein
MRPPVKSGCIDRDKVTNVAAAIMNNEHDDSFVLFPGLDFFIQIFFDLFIHTQLKWPIPT